MASESNYVETRLGECGGDLCGVVIWEGVEPFVLKAAVKQAKQQFQFDEESDEHYVGQLCYLTVFGIEHGVYHFCVKDYKAATKVIEDVVDEHNCKVANSLEDDEEYEDLPVDDIMFTGALYMRQKKRD